MIKINKKEVSEKHLYENACDLSDIKQELQTIVDYFGYISYMANEDDGFVANHFMNSGSFGNAIDVLQNITKVVGCISDNICPDEVGDSNE